MNTTALLKTIAVVELATGIGLVALPSVVAEVLAGQPLGPGASLLVGRVAGAALIAIGLTCWLQSASDRAGSSAGVLIGLLAYNGIVPLLLVHSYVVHGTSGIGLWPTVVLHIGFALWIAAALQSRRTTHGRSAS